MGGIDHAIPGLVVHGYPLHYHRSYMVICVPILWITKKFVWNSKWSQELISTELLQTLNSLPIHHNYFVDKIKLSRRQFPVNLSIFILSLVGINDLIASTTDMSFFFQNDVQTEPKQVRIKFFFLM